MPHLELNLAPTAQDMPDMAIALIRAIIAAAAKDREEMTVLLIHGEPAAVIAPYGHERRPGASAEIPSIACRSRNGAPAAHAWGEQATG